MNRPHRARARDNHSRGTIENGAPPARAVHAPGGAFFKPSASPVADAPHGASHRTGPGPPATSAARSAGRRVADPAAPSTRTPAPALVDAVTPRLAGHRRTSRLEITRLNCAALDEIGQQELAVTYWFDAKPSGEPYTVTVQLEGRLADGAREGAGRTAFTSVSTVEDVLPGSGRISVTTRIADVATGDWDVTARPVQARATEHGRDWAEVRTPRLARGVARGATTFRPAAHALAPGVVPGAWPALVGLGFSLAVLVLMLLATPLGLPVSSTVLLVLVASGLGGAGAKAYYVLTHPRGARSLLGPGMSVQGFVITAVAVMFLGSLVLDLPPGTVLDATAPGMLLAMSVGRLGCLFGGCCTGRPTASRWGVWSSDRRLGTRRIPVQLMESSFAVGVGLAALATVLHVASAGQGLVFAASISAYILGRQLLFPLRSVPRLTKHGIAVNVGIWLVVLVGSAARLLAVS